MTREPVRVWAWLIALAAIVAFLGGSSRADVVQIVALRPLVALFLAPAIYYLSRDALARAKALLAFFGMFAAWMALQLVPLPPSIWQSLPEREIIAEVDRLAGLSENWRPISWVPTRGWNALASLIVPLTALLLAVSLRARAHTLLLVIAGLGVLDALLGLLQVVSGRTSSLYFYAVTNRGSPVGIFANENHSAVLSAVVLLTIALLGASAHLRKDPPWLRLAYPPAYILVLMAALVSGSRAGLAFVVLALAASGAMIWLSLASTRGGRRQGKVEKWLSKHPRTVLLAFGGLIGLLIAGFLTLERAPGFEDIFAQDAFEDMRWQILPVLEQMLKTFWLVGIGFGSFEGVYHLYETTDLLLPSYVNQAHNDWAQLLIEGGVPATAIVACLLVWIAFALRALLRRKQLAATSFIYWSAVTMIIIAASFIDYPLRAPGFQLVAVWLLLALGSERNVQ